jgi:hypothetical protein
MYMSAFQFAATGTAQRTRDPSEERPRRPRGGEPQQEEAALPDGAVQYIAQAILQEGAPALAEEVLAEAPAPAVVGWTAGGEALEKVKEEAEALKRAAALQLSA